MDLCKKDPFFYNYEFKGSLSRDVCKQLNITKFIKPTLQTQKLAMSKATSILKQLNFKDNVVLDRCYIDVCAYSYYISCLGQMSTQQWLHYHNHVVNSGFDKIINVFFYNSPIGIPISDNGLRNTDVQFRNQIDENIKLLINYFNVRCVELIGSPQQRLQKIKATINVQIQKNK